MPSNANIVSIMGISQYLAIVDIEKQKATKGYYNGDTRLPILLYLVRKNLEWVLDQSITVDEGIQECFNFGFDLCGRYGIQAEAILGTAGGIVVNPTNGNTALVPYALTVTISAAQSGISTYQNNDLIGAQDLNQIVINQNVFQSGTQFTVNNISGTIDFSLCGYVLQENDLMTGLFFKIA